MKLLSALILSLSLFYTGSIYAENYSTASTNKQDGVPNPQYKEGQSAIKQKDETVDSNQAALKQKEELAALQQKEENEHLQEIVKRAFDAAKTEQLPLSTNQIEEYQDRLDKTATAIFPSPPPKMISRTQKVSLEPGATPVTVRLSPNYTSSIVIIDSTGQPWPITTATVGNEKFFHIEKPETGENNMLTINALKNHVSSNILVTLVGRDAPLIIELTMNDDNANKKPQEADILVSMRMNIPGPKASQPVLGSKAKSAVSSELMSFLDGVPAAGANIIKLRDAPEGVVAWEYNGQMYLRTPYLARWPAWIQQASSTSGVNAYVMPMASQIILSVAGASHPVAVVQ